MSLVGLRRGTSAPVTVEVRDLPGVDGDRPVVWAELGGETASGFRGVPMSSTNATMVAMGAEAARADGMPLVVVIASTGSDIVEGVAALDGWGRLAKSARRLLGDRADDHRRRRPGGVRAGPPARRRRPRRDDRVELRLRQRAGDGRGVHGRARDDRRARRDGRAGAAHRRAERRRPEPRGGHGGRRRPPRLPALERRRGPTPLAERRPHRPPLPRSRGADPGDGHRQLRRAAGRRGDRRRRQPARDPRPVGPQRRHGTGHAGRPPDRHRRQPADLPRRHAGHPGVAEGRPVRHLLRRLQPADRHARRHARLLSRQGPRVAGHDPSRRPARVRLRPGHRAADLRDPAQELRRGVHRHGLQARWATTSAWRGRGPSWP